MPKQKKNRKQPRRRAPAGDANQPRSLKRRMPRPLRPHTTVQLPPLPTLHQEEPHPRAGGLAEKIRQICRLARLDPYIVGRDWIGMAEAGLLYQAENARSYALTGQFIQDPPEVAAHFKRARERYLQATESYPATYRLMQEVFVELFSELQFFAAPGLAWYGQQTALNPDLIGQIFIELLRPGPQWRQYFPTWGAALARAGELYPPDEMTELIHQELVHTALLLQQRGDPSLVPLEPGVNFEAWLEALEPHFEPILIGPNAINSSAMMLAIAAQFPDWAVARGLVQFAWTGVDPLLQQMANINICLYGLNGYTLKLYQTAMEVAASLAERQRLPGRYPLPEGEPITPVPLGEAEPGVAPPPPVGSAEMTFEALFRRNP